MLCIHTLCRLSLLLGLLPLPLASLLPPHPPGQSPYFCYSSSVSHSPSSGNAHHPPVFPLSQAPAHQIQDLFSIQEQLPYASFFCLSCCTMRSYVKGKEVSTGKHSQECQGWRQAWNAPDAGCAWQGSLWGWKEASTGLAWTYGCKIPSVKFLTVGVLKQGYRGPEGPFSPDWCPMQWSH